VTVKVFSGPAPSGKVVAMATAPQTGGTWTSNRLSPALGDGTYTAVATQPSAIGNGQGESAPVTFTVDTTPPVVTLNGPLTPSANRAPSFSGSATDRTPVTVEIYPRAAAGGPPVAFATADVAAGEWVSGRAAPALAWGEYVAVARQPSSLGNPTGSSAPVSFTVVPITPLAGTEPATEVTRTSAALYGSVNPLGASIGTCAFEFGLAAAYGQKKKPALSELSQRMLASIISPFEEHHPCLFEISDKSKLGNLVIRCF